MLELWAAIHIHVAERLASGSCNDQRVQDIKGALILQSRSIATKNRAKRKTIINKSDDIIKTTIKRKV
jgi:hypothetical protein